MKQILQDLSLAEIQSLVSELGEPKFRAAQIYRGVMLGKRISDMSDLSKPLRAKLLERFEDEPVKVREVFTSSDGTEKYLFELADGNIIEGVLMSYKYGNTQCVSTQVGCRMNCAFCASGLNGLIRNLTAGEILAQILTVNARRGGTPEKRAVTNVVLMGSGEPLDNYGNTVKFLKNVTAEGGICISGRNISLSTCGLVPKMYELAEEGIPVNLTVSLHSPDDAERERIMPVAKAYKISEILKACDYGARARRKAHRAPERQTLPRQPHPPQRGQGKAPCGHLRKGSLPLFRIVGAGRAVGNAAAADRRGYRRGVRAAARVAFKREIGRIKKCRKQK